MPPWRSTGAGTIIAVLPSLVEGLISGWRFRLIYVGEVRCRPPSLVRRFRASIVDRKTQERETADGRRQMADGARQTSSAVDK